MISRRGLFGLFGGVAAAPLVKALPAEAEPELYVIGDVTRHTIAEGYETFERYSGYDVINTSAANDWAWRTIVQKEWNDAYIDGELDDEANS